MSSGKENYCCLVPIEIIKRIHVTRVGIKFGKGGLIEHKNVFKNEVEQSWKVNMCLVKNLRCNLHRTL